MKYIVWYFFIVQCIATGKFLFLLAHNKYPRKPELVLGDDLVSLTVRVGLGIWAAWILFR